MANQIELESQTNWNISTAIDATEGINKAKSLRPDAILLDLSLPDLEGLDTARTLKFEPTTRTIPILLTTTMSQAEVECLNTDLAEGVIFQPSPTNANYRLVKIHN
ncbi:response regulator [Pleurocapsales cyanobacterium LEGE 10410]|nr:response regulator [Pleurocapsales cyanobacterium LEGE 10410]